MRYLKWYFGASRYVLSSVNSETTTVEISNPDF
jgi:hypothetical protein